jgi:hypothetical protein
MRKEEYKPCFYDAHCHMMNLSHPNLTAIIRRIYFDSIRPLLKRYLIYFIIVPVSVLVAIRYILSVSYLQAFYGLSLLLGALILILLLVFSIPAVREFMVSKLRKKLSNVMNLLAVMETDIGDCLIQLEEELRGKFNLENGMVISGDGEKRVYDKIILTPLIMDFALKENRNINQQYRVRWKPIVAQVEDLCLGIRDYYRHRKPYIEPKFGDKKPLFQIYPFMGINTQMYHTESEESAGKSFSVTLESLLKKNFGEFGNDDSPEQRRENLQKIEWRDFTGDIDSIGSYYFIGIKVYPPLGFDPWPEPGIERDKVCILYDFCIKNKIPITAHCSPGGFLVNKAYKDYSSPYKWEMVLNQYNDLRLNLAHFGGVESRKWPEKIVNLILEYDSSKNDYKYPNLYTDISYQGVDKSSYKKIKRFIDNMVRGDENKRLHLMERIIFGSDFMINLQDIRAYSDYLRYYIDSDVFTLKEKDQFCRNNTERFLYLE